MVVPSLSHSEVQYVVLQNVATMSIKRRVSLGLGVGGVGPVDSGAG